MRLSVWPARSCLTNLPRFSYSRAQEGKPEKASSLHAGGVGDDSEHELQVRCYRAIWQCGRSSSKPICTSLQAHLSF